MKEVKVFYPHHYIWMCKDNENGGRLLKRYVSGYLRKVHPGLRLIRIEKNVAICEFRPLTEGEKLLKHGKKPNRRQKLALTAAGYDENAWLVVKALQGSLHIVSRETGELKVIAAT